MVNPRDIAWECGKKRKKEKRQAKLLIHAEKMKEMPDHPLHQKLKDLTKKHIEKKKCEPPNKRTSVRTTDVDVHEKLNPNSLPPETLQAEIRTTIRGITSKENQSKAVLRALALEEIDKHYPAASWTHIYTDGSAENATRKGGCGAYIKHPGKPPLSVSAPGRTLCSNYRAEVLALLNATETIISWEEKPQKTVSLTDSLSALQLSCWWIWHNAKEAHREHQHPRSDYLYCSSVDTSLHRH